jgi:hypothetical protein
MVVFIPATTRHSDGAEPGENMTHWPILGPAVMQIAD